MSRIYKGINPESEEIARITAGLAHDLNNVLLILQGCIELISLEKAGNLDATMNRLFEDMQTAVKTGSKISGRLMDVCSNNLEKFISMQKGKRLLDLNEIVRDSVQIAKRKIRNGVEFFINLEPDLWPVEGDEVNIERLLINLVDNAQSAIPESGLISIFSENMHLSEQAKPFVCISVKDTGKGIDQSLLANIFKPFYTTKGRGHGMGMPVVKQVAEDHGGWIEIETDPGHGSHIKVFFPANVQRSSLAACAGSNN